MKKYQFIFLAAILAGCSDSGSSDVGLLECTDTCENGLICDNGFCKRPVANGESCASSDALCINGTCEDGICTGDIEITACDDAHPCDSGYICLEGECVEGAAPGDNCHFSPCLKGVCQDDICVVTVKAGQACTKGYICEDTDICTNGTCLKALNLGDDCRSSLGKCVNSTCIGGKCEKSEEQSLSKDTDGDTIPDKWDRCDADTDGDTVPDCQDLDSDGDTIPDEIEYMPEDDGSPADSDFDGIYDFMSLDSDSNGIPDALEGKRKAVNPETGDPITDENGNPVYDYIDTDGDTVIDSSDFDNDGDGLEDSLEIVGTYHNKYMGYLIAADCNGDTIPDPPGSPYAPRDCDGDTVPDYMDLDSDGDTIGDRFELISDSNTDGFLDRYSIDSDGDTIPDSEEKHADPDIAVPPLCNAETNICEYKTPDIDNDGLSDGLEVDCGELGHSRYTADTDNDGFDDASEYAAAIYANADPKDFICNAEKNVQSVFEFYFNLPYGDPAKEENLEFEPQVSKLDVMFNVDTTQSMGKEIENLQNSISDVIVPQIRDRVSDSAFGVSRFDDFPTRGTVDSKYDYAPGQGIKYGYGRWFDDKGTEIKDTPFELLGEPIAAMSQDPAILQAIKANIDKLSLHNGSDLSESGYESLWQLVMADDRTKPQVSWYSYMNRDDLFRSGSLPYADPGADRWGGGKFRNKSLPVIIHITDAASHDIHFEPYDPVTVENAHYSPDVHHAYTRKGARIVSIFTKSRTQLPQLIQSSQETKTYVPVCAFMKEDSSWRCGENKCCTVDGGVDPIDINGKNSCVLSYAIQSAANLSTSLVDGVDAMVKYAANDVAAVVRGEKIENNPVDTSCFIKRVESLDNGYVAPPQEPEQSCNPVAVPHDFGNVGYNNGFSNFATGTSNVARPGAKLNFRVVAENDHCVKPQVQAQVFNAYIDIVDPTTGMVFDTQRVAIVVPGQPTQNIN